MASLAIGIAGAAIGSLFGMPALGFAIGSAIGSALFPAKGPDGPRLQDLRLQTSSYGKMIPFVYGAMRVAGNIIWTTDLKEHKHKSGGKGGPSVTTFTYTASFATMICEGPVQTIRRIWADGTLVYNTDAAASTTPLPTIPVTIYLGTDTQGPDPTMESILGVGQVPANHGYAYCVFTDWDMGAFGNRLPSLNFEVVTVAIPTVQIYVVLQYTPAGPWRSGYYHVGAPDPYIVSWDATVIRIANFPLYDTLLADAVTLAPTGTTPREAQDFYPEREDFSVPHVGDFSAIPAGVYNGQPLYRDDRVLVVPSGGPSLFLGMGIVTADDLGMHCPFDFGDLIPSGLYLQGCIQSSDRTQNYLFVSNGAETLFYWYKFSGDTPVLVDQGTIEMGSSYHDASGEVQGLFGMCDASGAIHKKGTAENGAPYIWELRGANALLMYIDDAKVLKIQSVNLIGPNQLQPVPNPESPVDTGQAGGLYSPSTGYCGVCFGNNITLLSRIPPSPATAVTLASIVQDLSGRAGLAPSDLDVTQLVDLVDGYMVEQQAAARDCVTPLQSAFFFDGVESAGKMKFVKRGAAPALVIPNDDLAASPTNSAPPARLPWKRAQEVDLPATLSVSYVNGGAAYQIGTQYGRRLVTSSQLALTAALAINMTDEKANAVAWTLLASAWLGRQSYTVMLPRKYWYLEPTDVITAHNFTMRLTAKRDRLDGVIEFEGIATNQSVWVQAPVPATGTGGGTSSPPIIQPTNVLLLDIPLIADTDLQAGFYAAYAGSVDDTWRGAALLKSYDAGASFAQVDATTSASTIGVGATILPPFYGGNIFDEASVVSVVIGAGGGDLASESETNVLNGANAAVLGDEIIQYKNAVLTAPSTYNLSGLLRGRRGTEWAIPTHVTPERFVALPADDVSGPQSDVGMPLTYAAVTTGGSVATTAKETFENDGAGARCYSPVQVYGSVDAASGDVTIRWTRRTRVGGQWQNLTDAPLSEAAELYVVQIWNSDYTLCARVITGLTSPSVVYTAAQQITDFGAQQLSIFVTVGQIGLFGLGTQAGAILAGNGATIDAPLAPVAPYNSAPPSAPPGSCTGTVYNQTMTWALGDSGIVLQPPFFDGNSTWVLKFTTPASGSETLRVNFFEYGGTPGTRHVTLSLSPCGAPLIPAAKQDQFYPSFWCYMNAPNPHPTIFPTLLLNTTYYFTIKVGAHPASLLPMAYEADIEAR